jgi:hypothetical protein
MPYRIIREREGYFVYNPATKKTYSNRGLTLEKARKQRIAIIYSEHPNTTDVRRYFLD